MSSHSLKRCVNPLYREGRFLLQCLSNNLTSCDCYFKGKRYINMYNYYNISIALLFWEIQSVCSWTVYYSHQQGNISSRFSKNSKADASEFIENLKKMFPRYWPYIDAYHNIYTHFKTNLNLIKICFLYTTCMVISSADLLLHHSVSYPFEKSWIWWHSSCLLHFLVSFHICYD